MNEEKIRLRHWIGGALIALAVSAIPCCGMQPTAAEAVRIERQELAAPPMPFEPTDEELAAMGYVF